MARKPRDKAEAVVPLRIGAWIAVAAVVMEVGTLPVRPRLSHGLHTG